MSTLFWILIGAFIGWNFPQPRWARMIQEKAAKAVKEMIK